MLVFYIPWKYFRQHCCLDIIIFCSIPNCSQCGFWLEHHGGRNTMKWNRNLSVESCQSRIHSAGMASVDLPLNYIFFLTFWDHKALTCPALVEFRHLGSFYEKKGKNIKISTSIRALRWNSECFPCWLGLFQSFLCPLWGVWLLHMSWARRRLLYCSVHRRAPSSFSWGKTSQKK